MLNMKIFVFVLFVIPVLSRHIDHPKRHVSTSMQGSPNPYEFYLWQEDPVNIENINDAESLVNNVLLAAAEDDSVDTENLDEIEFHVTDAEKPVEKVDLEFREGRLKGVYTNLLLRGSVGFRKEGNKRLITVPAQYTSLKVRYDQFYFQTTPSDISDLYKDYHYFEGSLVVNVTVAVAYDQSTGKLSLEYLKPENTEQANYRFSKESSPKPYIHIKSFIGLYDPYVRNLLDEKIQAMLPAVLQKKAKEVLGKASTVLQALKMRKENIF